MAMENKTLVGTFTDVHILSNFDVF